MKFIARVLFASITTSAVEFLGMLKNWTIFESCAISDLADSTYQLGPELPAYEALPPSITTHVRALEKAPDKYAVWAELVGRIAHIVNQGGCIDSEFAEVLERRTDGMSDWLALLTPSDDAVPLTGDCQRFLARIIRRADAGQGGLDIGGIQAFARQVAPRLNLLHGPMATFFEKEFVERDSNRELLLRSPDDSTRRREISQQLIAHAKGIQDRTRLRSQLTVAAILDPSYDGPRLSLIRRTLTVLRILQELGYISSTQFEDLAGDIRRRLPDSMEFLVAPHLGASGEAGRLAKLYLALYEECEKYEYYGDTGNFGITTAVYGKLNRDIDRDA